MEAREGTPDSRRERSCELPRVRGAQRQQPRCACRQGACPEAIRTRSQTPSRSDSHHVWLGFQLWRTSSIGHHRLPSLACLCFAQSVPAVHRPAGVANPGAWYNGSAPARDMLVRLVRFWLRTGSRTGNGKKRLRVRIANSCSAAACMKDFRMGCAA